MLQCKKEFPVIELGLKFFIDHQENVITYIGQCFHSKETKANFQFALWYFYVNKEQVYYKSI